MGGGVCVTAYGFGRRSPRPAFARAASDYVRVEVAAKLPEVVRQQAGLFGCHEMPSAREHGPSMLSVLLLDETSGRYTSDLGSARVERQRSSCAHFDRPWSGRKIVRVIVKHRGSEGVRDPEQSKQ